MMADFNTEPIMLRHASSLAAADKMILYQQPCFPEEDCGDMMDVPQNLEPEQERYEFPPKAHLQALAQIYDNDDDCSFFDESSYTTTSTATESYPLCSPSTDYANDHLDRFFDSVLDDVWEKKQDDDDDDDDYIIDDGRLSPLQLPAQSEVVEQRGREQSYDSMATVTKDRGVAPCSFLSSLDEHSIEWPDQGSMYRRAGSEDLPVFCSESELRSPSTPDSERTTDSQVVLIRLSKKKKASPIPRCPSNQTTWSSDEGYDDNDDLKEMPIESASIFLPLSDQEQEHLIHNDILRSAAAVKIQAVWRGFSFRSKQKSSRIKPKHRLLVDVLRLCGGVYRQQMTRVQHRMHDMEEHLREETAMRIAFEKAMEDMTILVDQQQKVLYDRLEQEINMRQVYERKMEESLAQIHPIESRLRKETKARGELESMMTCVLEQMHEMKRESKAESEARKKLQQQLEDAQAEIAKLKKSRLPPSSAAAAAAATTNTAIARKSTATTRTGLTVHAGARSVSAMAAPNKSTARRTTTPAPPTTTNTINTTRASSRMDTTKRPIPRTTTPVSRKR